MTITKIRAAQQAINGAAARLRKRMLGAFEDHPLAKPLAPLIAVAGGLVLTLIAPFALIALLGDAVAIGVIALAVLATTALRGKVPITPKDQTFANPDPEAMKLAQLNGHGERLIVGGSIELAPHPNLNLRLGLADLGWNPDQVGLVASQARFDPSPLIEAIPSAEKGIPSGRNGAKFAVASYPPVGTDSPTLEITLSRTDYHTIATVLPAVEAKPELRQAFGSLEPERNRIPNSLCLHVVVRFRNADLLGMVRDPGLLWAPGVFSISFEEQLTATDLSESNKPASRWFHRALLEEVFALRENTSIGERWALVADQVDSIRIWSLFVEQERLNFSLLGVCDLTIDAATLASSVRRRIGRTEGSLDREGAYYRVPLDVAIGLVQGRPGTVYPVYDGPPMLLTVEMLHQTSRYRLFRLLHALHVEPFG